MNKKSFPARLENLEPMLDFLTEISKKHGVDTKKANQIRLAAEEVLINIINYAYLNNEGNIEVDYTITEGMALKIEISDSGIPFNPLALPEPDISVPIEKRKIGGLGIHLIRNIIDKVSYKREHDKNILTLIKY